MSEEKFTLFYQGVFSNWQRCSFVVDGVTYCSTEQYMMAAKARLFKDEVTEKSIMSVTHPLTIKKLGRDVKPFDKNLWNSKARDAVYKGCYAKFQQNPEFLKQLKETAGTTLVEASPTDRIWGIGLGAQNANAHDRSKWRGTNWLGEVLTKVRDDLIADKYTTSDFGWSK